MNGVLIMLRFTIVSVIRFKALYDDVTSLLFSRQGCFFLLNSLASYPFSEVPETVRKPNHASAEGFEVHRKRSINRLANDFLTNNQS